MFGPNASSGRRPGPRSRARSPRSPALPPASAGATDYSSAAEAFSAIDELQVEVAGRLQTLAEGSSHAFAQSLLRDLERHRIERARDRNTQMLVAKAAHILQGRQQARSDEAKSRGHAVGKSGVRLSVPARARAASASYSLSDTGWKLI